jgi:Fic family protein
MKAMISDLNSDLKEATKSGKIDAVAFSAKYCHNFVNIHPFLDDNGRTCRLIDMVQCCDLLFIIHYWGPNGYLSL